MTPAEVDALLRIKQARERRARGVLEGARRAEQAAVDARALAEQRERAALDATGRAQRHAFETMEASETLRAPKMQSALAEVAGLRAQAGELAKKAKQAAAVQQGRRVQAEDAAAAHSATLRAAEAFDALRTELRSASAKAAEGGEELEAEEPRRAPPARR